VINPMVTSNSTNVNAECRERSRAEMRRGVRRPEAI